MNGESEEAGEIISSREKTDNPSLARPNANGRPMDVESEEAGFKRRLENTERELQKSKKQIKHLKKELASAEKERKEILSTVSSLYVQVQYWNTWFGKNFSGQGHLKESKLKNEENSQANETNDTKSSPELNILDNISQKDETETKITENASASCDNSGKQESNENKIVELKNEGHKDSSVADMLKETAQNALANTGMSYDARTGLYYDWNCHMYYDPTSHLYYDNDNGIYYYFDAEKHTYVFHSQIKVPEADSSSPESTNEKSEGEISSSEDEYDAEKVPCIRAITKVSTSLKSGSLYFITCNGATAGRDKNKHLIHIPDVEASKDHVEISYQQNDCQYYIRDVGSINGTFLNDQRLSDSKTKSEWIKIKHKDYLRIGMTTLCLHVHYGQETCDDCEPGQVQALLSAEAEEKEDLNSSVLSRDAQRKKQLKGLKKKYMVEGDGLRKAMEPISSGKYKDRSDKRRKTIGSSNSVIERHAVVSKASVTEKISHENKGHKMMQQMGWKIGEGLGKGKTGIKEPINVIIREQNKGLGTGVSKSIDEVGGKSANYKWKKARQRYDDIVHQENNGDGDNEEMPIDVF